MEIAIWMIEDITEANKNEPKIYIVSTSDKRQVKVKYYAKSDIFLFDKEIEKDDKIIIENHFRNNVHKILNS